MKNPTLDMSKAGYKKARELGGRIDSISDCDDIYRAMVAASPLLPQQGGEQTDLEVIAHSLEAISWSLNTSALDSHIEKLRAMAAVLPQVGETSDINNIVANELRRIADEAPINGSNLARMRVLMAADQFLAAAPVAQALPVAADLDARDAARWRMAMSSDINAEALHTAVLDNGSDHKAAGEAFDAAVAALQGEKA